MLEPVPTMTNLKELSTEELTTLKEQLTLKHITLNNVQTALKLCGNSCYGAMGSPGCMWFNRDVAEAVTVSGRYLIINLSEKINEYLSSVVGDRGQFAIYSDTDSVVVNLKPLVDKFCIGKTPAEIESFVDVVCKTKVASLIKEALKVQVQATNARLNVLSVKRENIADKAILIASKRYIMQVVNKEGGIHLQEPKLKMTGIEAVRTSTPPSCRAMIPKVLKAIFNTSEPAVQKMLADYRKEFETLPLKEVAKTSGINNMDKYYDAYNKVWRPKTPVALKAAIAHNHLLEKHGLTDRYPMIRESDKISFLYLKQNPSGYEVIGFMDKLPSEFGLEPYIDWDDNFQRLFLNPIERILEVIGWHVEEQMTLDGLFE